jgi:hypothetical protein
MAKVIIKIAGLDGQVELRDDRIIIHRKGLWNAMQFGLNAKREIPLGAISEVMFRDASTFRFGEIEFVRGGRSVDEKKSARNSTVRFAKKDNTQFEALKEKIFELMSQLARQRQ